MEKDFEDFIVARCEEAKKENADYMNCELGDNDPEEVQSMAEMICYLKGIKDARTILTYLKL